MIKFVSNTPMFTNWVQIEMTKTLQTMQINHMIKFFSIIVFHFLCSWNMF
jgi:hypothetical protein